MQTRLLRPFILLAMMFAMAACASLPQEYPRQPSLALQHTEDTRIGEAIAPLLQAHGDDSGFYLLSSGVDAFIARMIMATAAERSIDLQYYLFNEDTSGRLLAGRLIEAADRGVRVRLLLDDIDTVGKDGHLAALDAHDNIEVRLFNPFASRDSRYHEFVARFGEVTRRMHNKAFIVDNQVAIVGGRNIGDAYFERRLDFEFGDLDLLSIGTIVPKVSNAFDLYWNHGLSIPIKAINNHGSAEALNTLRAELKKERKTQSHSDYRQKIEASTLLSQLRQKSVPFHWGRAEVLYDLPDKVSSDSRDSSTHMLPALQRSLADTHKELIVFSPYFVPTQAGVELFARLEKSGIEIKILTNSLAANDVPAVHAGYRRYRIPLLQAGVELYELKPIQRRAGRGSGFSGSSRTSLHAKSIVSDRSKIFIGSFNLDPRSMRQNTEMGIMVESPPLALELVNWLEKNLDEISYRLVLTQEDESADPEIVWIETGKDGDRIYDDEPEAGWWRRLQVLFFSLLPIEEQL